MPQIFRIGPYSIYFWSNEGEPLEPVHVHISEGQATKLWITSTGKVILSNNNYEEIDCAPEYMYEHSYEYPVEFAV